MASRSSSALVTTALATATRIPQPRNATRTMVPTRRNSSLHSLLAAPSTCETCFANTTETDLVPTIFSVTSIGATWYVPEETYYISGGGFSNYVSFQLLCCGPFAHSLVCAVPAPSLPGNCRPPLHQEPRRHLPGSVQHVSSSRCDLASSSCLLTPCFRSSGRVSARAHRAPCPV